MLYKTTDAQGGPLHGGRGEWPLPKDGQPGGWREEKGELVKCSRGLHLTDDPARRWRPGCRIWLAEAEGVVGSCDDDADRKIVCRRARLVREVTDAAELAALRIYVAGSHAVKGATFAVAYDSASVRAYDSASVEAYDSASVEAYDSASVRAPTPSPSSPGGANPASASTSAPSGSSAATARMHRRCTRRRRPNHAPRP